MKGRSIQDNLQLIREVLEGIEDGTEAALISLDQSKAFDRIDHRFLATVLETAGFEPGFEVIHVRCLVRLYLVFIFQKDSMKVNMDLHPTV